MKKFNYDLNNKWIPLDVENSSGLGIIKIWQEDIIREFNEISLFIDFLDISFLKKLEEIKNKDIFWRMSSINVLYDLQENNKEIIMEQSLLLIKDLDKLNKEIMIISKYL
ncbi:hypothetical protein Holit_00034 [Hollandina sp. SP2]